MNDAALRHILRSVIAVSMPVATAACGGNLEESDTRAGDPAPATRAVPVCSSASLPADTKCAVSLQLPCSIDRDAFSVESGVCERFCPAKGDALSYCTVARDPSAEPYLSCLYCASGRRPEGLVAVATPGGAPLGVHFAGMAHLEASSVLAFMSLRAELVSFAAPHELVDRAARAAHDEIRHARATADLARRFGAEPGPWSATPTASRRADRSLEEIATENAVEGCVRETYGALVAQWQARQATDASIRYAMRLIARDEARHAALAWSVDEWIRPLLDAAGRARVQAAFERAIVELRAELGADPDPAIAALGLPSAEAARHLLDVLAESLRPLCAA
ncbi:MAG: ferritin-like domain-containing protein [Labilithrix sp.]|nr:ferritin-like domain-containing protein [Labilithrix sp.]